MSSVAFTRWPQPSHWSPRASSYEQRGHVPSTNLSARYLLQCSHNSCSTLSVFIKPFSYNCRNISWQILQHKGSMAVHNLKNTIFTATVLFLNNAYKWMYWIKYNFKFSVYIGRSNKISTEHFLPGLRLEPRSLPNTFMFFPPILHD